MDYEHRAPWRLTCRDRRPFVAHDAHRSTAFAQEGADAATPFRSNRPSVLGNGSELNRAGSPQHFQSGDDPPDIVITGIQLCFGLPQCALSGGVGALEHEASTAHCGRSCRLQAVGVRPARGRGFDVVGCADDGVTALCMSHELKPDAVLRDVQLPDTDGFVVADELCSWPDPPVVLTSS